MNNSEFTDGFILGLLAGMVITWFLIIIAS